MNGVSKWWLLLVLALASASGCGRGDRPPLGTVEGVVSVKGTPLDRGRIYFVPKNGGRTSEGEIGPDGRYRLVYSLDEFGAIVGEHTVKVSTQNEFGGGERIPDRYNATSELTASVKRGKNEQNFDLAEELELPKGGRKKKSTEQ